MGIFDSKNFNSQVFEAYVEKTPSLNRNELIKSRAVKTRQDIAGTFRDQTGGNYAVIPITGRIGGTPLNYDGSTDITSKKLKTYTQGRIVVGRADSWVENDFSYTNVYCDFMPEVSKQLEAINLSKWEHTVGAINDGSGVQYIQIQVRRSTAQEAYRVCSELFQKLDSGTEESIINLTDEKICVARPRRGAIILERGEGYTTYYCEIALWGDN